LKRTRKSADTTTPPKIDIRGVAALARVSIATVSRTINHVPTVDPVLAARVWKAVTELNYFPNTQARALVSGKSRLLGLVVSEITNPFFPELIQEFENIAVAHGYEILIGSTNYETKTMEICARRMLERQVDGVAMMTFGADQELLSALAAQRFPVVTIGKSKLRGVQAVGIDFGSGIREAVQHLAVLGHRRMAFISGPLRVDNSRARQEAFLHTTHEAGIKVPRQFLFEGDHSMESGLKGADGFLALPNRPTAILCSNDMTAIGALHAVSARNLRVPKDISVVGFDDIHMAQFTVPPLTTVRMSCEDIARAALDTLISAIEGRQAQQGRQGPPTALLPTRLVVRQSTDYAPRTDVPVRRQRR
jgi:DNA-binding LacI/PurR family transcriptional regulator